MNRIALMLLASGLLTVGSCTNKQPVTASSVEKSAGEILAEAYQNKDWETVVSIGDTLISDKDTMNLTVLYAEALAATENPQKALLILDKKLESAPDNYYLYQTKGDVYYLMEKYDSAIINYEKVISMKPTYARPYIHEGEICEIIGDKPRAVANYLAAMRLFAANNFYQETLEFANRVLSLDPTNEEANELVGKARQ
jgi:tetratricopeptide (TPR) repeat protein